MPKNKNPASIPIPPAVVMYCNFIQHKLSTIFIIYHIISTYCPQGNLVKLTKFLSATLKIKGRLRAPCCRKVLILGLVNWSASNSTKESLHFFGVGILRLESHYTNKAQLNQRDKSEVCSYCYFFFLFSTMAITMTTTAQNIIRPKDGCIIFISSINTDLSNTPYQPKATYIYIFL